MRTPVAVVAGIDPVAADATVMSLMFDLPRAVAVRHRIDPHSQILTRTVSDLTGVIEREQFQLEHACVSCALREDILPTLERLARDPRWDAIIAALPTATEADQLAQVISLDRRLARHLRLSSMIVAAGGDDLVRDLLGDELLSDRGLHSNPGDDRGLGEVACAQIEMADTIVVGGEPSAEGLDLVRALARPDARVITGAEALDAEAALSGRHEYARSSAWRWPDRDTMIPNLARSSVWRVDLTSPRPFHPDRLLDQIERLGAGPVRSRGCFWVPTRPGDMQEWSGVGGQLSIGSHSPWDHRDPITRLVFTGLGEVPIDVVDAFTEVLCSPNELNDDGVRWSMVEDGLEPWLGDIRDVA